MGIKHPDPAIVFASINPKNYLSGWYKVCAQDRKHLKQLVDAFLAKHKLNART